MTETNPICLFMIGWLLTSCLLTMGYIIVATINKRWGSISNFFEIHLRKYLKP